jgi:hypothetical protein
MTNLTVVQACTFSISPTSKSFDVNGGQGSVSVTAPNGCNWTAVKNASWITITSGANGSGNGSVSYTVGANPGTGQRVGTITIGGKTFTATQGGDVPTVTMTSPTCVLTSSVGGGYYDYDFSVHWTATGPVGASLQFNQNLYATFGASTCTDTGCPWTATPTDGDCTRGPNDPAEISGTYCFGFSGQGDPFIYGGPEIDMVDSDMYDIASGVTGNVTCK